MQHVKCEWCGTEQPGDTLIIVLKCQRCQHQTWHYRADRWVELRNMDHGRLAKLIKDLAEGRREGSE